MDVFVQTGQTKTDGDIALTSKSLTSQSGEQVFLLLQLHAEHAAAKTLQKEVLAIVEQSLLETDGDATQRLDSSLKELNGLLKGLLLSKSVKDVNAIIAMIEPDGMLHVSHAGRAEAYVVRSNTATQITEYTRGKPTPTFVHIASGQVEEADTIIFSTQRLLRTVTPAQLAKLASTHDGLLDELKRELAAEREQAALAVVHIKGEAPATVAPPPRKTAKRSKGTGGGLKMSIDPGALLSRVSGALSVAKDKGKKVANSSGSVKSKLKGVAGAIHKDLSDPDRKKRAHLLLLAGIVAIFLTVWALAHLTTFSQRNQTRTELQQLVEQINSDLNRAENRRLAGDREAASAILQRAEDQTKQVMNDESGLFRTEALDLFERIRSKREEIQNIVRLTPRVAANLSAEKAAIKALGFVGLADEEFIVYDRQDLYRVIYNNVEEAERLSEEELILDGLYFDRYQTYLFPVTGNGLIEIISGQATSMKTEDPAGWISGKDLKTYLRFLYVLSPENNQIYKYERLSNRYSAPVEYNINAELSNAIDMTIDSNIYVLKEGGDVTKLFRGETQPFSIRHAPDGLLKHATKVYKVSDGHFYFLDPKQSRIIIVADGGASGEASYLKQFVLEGDQVGELKDLYIDADESRLFVLDEKRVYKIDLAGR